MNRPAGLVYAVDERPPSVPLLALAVQHIFLMSSTLVLPVILVAEIGGGPDQVRAVVAMTMIAAGLGTILQAVRWWGIGSGFLCPNLAGPNFFSVCVGAAWFGGLPMMRGMTIAAGLVELVLARALPRLAFLFPPPITGLVVFMVAISLVPVGASRFFGINFEGEQIQGLNLGVAAATLLTMAGISVWGSARLRLYGLLIGLTVGYLLSIATGELTQSQYKVLADVPWIGLPSYDGFWNISFSWSLLPAFVIVSICGALKSFGNLVMCERVNDDNWTKPDIRRVGGGLTADAITVTVSGLLGGMATDTSASNVGLSKATGATSRWIGGAAGLLFIALGFSPKLAATLSIMPDPVAGAVLVFVVSFMFISGCQMMLSEKPDNRMTFVLGISLLVGLSADIVPAIYAHVPGVLRPLLGSSLTLATVSAIVLHRVFSLGARRTRAAPVRAASLAD